MIIGKTIQSQQSTTTKYTKHTKNFILNRKMETTQRTDLKRVVKRMAFTQLMNT
jgi:hypothetical protein